MSIQVKCRLKNEIRCKLCAYHLVEIVIVSIMLYLVRIPWAESVVALAVDRHLIAPWWQIDWQHYLNPCHLNGLRCRWRYDLRCLRKSPNTLIPDQIGYKTVRLVW